MLVYSAVHRNTTNPADTDLSHHFRVLVYISFPAWVHVAISGAGKGLHRQAIAAARFHQPVWNVYKSAQPSPGAGVCVHFPFWLSLADVYHSPVSLYGVRIMLLVPPQKSFLQRQIRDCYAQAGLPLRTDLQKVSVCWLLCVSLYICMYASPLHTLRNH